MDVKKYFHIVVNDGTNVTFLRHHLTLRFIRFTLTLSALPLQLATPVSPAKQWEARSCIADFASNVADDRIWRLQTCTYIT